MGNVKATRWIDCNEYLIKEFGDEKVHTIIDSLSEEDQKRFNKKLLPIMWLDYDAYIRYLFAADKLLGKGDNKLFELTSRYTANKHFKGMYKMFISFTSPEYIIKKSARVWKQYFDIGVMEALDRPDKQGALKLTDYKDIPLHHDLSHTPFMEEVLRMSSAKNPHGKHVKCMARGDDHCLWEFHWE